MYLVGKKAHYCKDFIGNNVISLPLKISTLDARPTFKELGSISET